MGKNAKTLRSPGHAIHFWPLHLHLFVATFLHHARWYMGSILAVGSDGGAELVQHEGYW